MRKFLLISFIVLLLGGLSFYLYMRGKVRVDPEAPIFTSFEGYPQSELSTLVFPLSIAITDISHKINETLESKPIHISIPIDDGKGTLEMDIEFYDLIKLKWNSPKLYADVPIHFSATATTTRLGIALTNKKPVEAKAMVSMLVKPEIVKGWKIECDATLENIKWEQEPQLELGKIIINLTKQVESKIATEQEKIEEVVESQINKALKLTDAIEKIWFDIQKPIALNKKGTPLWLSMEGQDLSACWNNEPSKDPSVIISVHGYYSLTVGDSSSLSKKPTPLPDYKKLNSPEKAIQASIAAKIPYDEMSKLTKTITDTLNLNYSGYELRIRKVDFLGGDSLLYLKLALGGDVRGSVYLKGQPRFMEDGKTFLVDHFDYDLYTENELASTADDWLHDYLLEKANQVLVFKFDSLLTKLPDAIMNGIEKSKVGDKLDLDMQELTVIPQEVRSAKDHLSLTIQVNGKAALQLESEVLNSKKKKR